MTGVGVRYNVWRCLLMGEILGCIAYERSSSPFSNLNFYDEVVLTWTVMKFPEAPIRHGNKFWTWLHWHVDVEIAHLLRAENVTVRCFNVFKNTQPKRPSWNTMGYASRH